MSSSTTRQSATFRFVTFAVGAGVAMIGLSTALSADLSHEVGKVKTELLREASGMAASRTNPDVLWLHNDGPSPQLFAVSTTGKLIATLDCDAEAADLEDIAIGPGPRTGVDYLYLGDIGDNSARRREVRVIRFPEPELAGERGQRLTVKDADVFRLVYPDGPHNAESLLVAPTTGELVIVTKERRGAHVYTIQNESLARSATATLAAAGTVAAEEVSAGAISFDGRRLILRRENLGWLWDRTPSERVAETLARKPRTVEVLGKRQGPNGESISFTPRGDGYYTLSEGKKPSIYRFDLPARTHDANQ